MNLYQLPEEQLLLFVVVLLRVIGFVVAMPVFGTISVPAQLKILFAVIFSLTLYPVVMSTTPRLEILSDSLLWISAKEATIGLFLGFLVRFFFFSLSVAGDLVGVSGGFASAQLFNPAMGEQASALDFFYVMLATVTFLMLGGHHLFISSFADSFIQAPVTSMGFNSLSATQVAGFGQEVLAIGFRLAAPVWVSILVANVAMGLLGKAVPHINIFVMSFHVTILLAFVVMIISLPLFVSELGVILEGMATNFGQIVKTL